MKKTIILIVAVTTLASFSFDAAKNSFRGEEKIQLKIKSSNVLSASMDGPQEAPVDGDPNGTGFVELILNQGQGTITYTITVENIDPATAAHIHLAPPGTAGPVVVPLNPPTSGSSSGVATADKDLIKAIRKNPENYYVNVHNTPYPGGAVRGQLSR